MSFADKMRSIASVKPLEAPRLALTWSDGTQAVVEFGEILDDRRFASLRDRQNLLACRLADGANASPGRAALNLALNFFGWRR